MNAVLALVLLLPLAAAALAPALGRRALWLLPAAPLPALLLALQAPPLRVELPWLLVGAVVGLDPVGRTFLLFGALLWSSAGFYAVGYLRADPRPVAFALWWLLALAGYLLLALAQDPVSFYLGFTQMSLAAYGLVVHRSDAAAVRAGRVYLVLTLLGEVALFAGILLQLDGWKSPALLLVPLALKAGLVPLHFWLPLAHPAAPAPASAVLSGVMIKAGLLGWLRWYPPGSPATVAGGLLLTAALASVFGGILLGLTQREPKAVLAYSSVSQMGMIACGFAVSLMAPQAGGILLPALLLYAVHHGLAKGALFLGTGHAGGTLWWGGMILAALALAGAPLTGGALAKSALKAGLAGEAAWLGPTLAVAAAGTTLLLGRFLLLLRERAAGAVPGRSQRLAFLVTVVLSQWLPWALAQELGKAWSLAGLWSAGWPVLLGLAALALARGRYPLRLPAGDLVVPAERLAGRVLETGRSAGGWLSSRPRMALRPWTPPPRWERRLQRWSGGGAAFLLVLGVLALAAVLG